MKYLIFEVLLLALLAAVAIWRKKGCEKIDKPKETEDGKFGIPKPEDEFMEGIECDEVRTDPEFKAEIYGSIKDPKGKPTGRPQ